MRHLTSILIIALCMSAGAYDPEAFTGALTTITETGAELEAAQATIAELQAEVETLRGAVDSANTVISSLETDLGVVRADLATAEATIETRDATILEREEFTAGLEQIIIEQEARIIELETAEPEPLTPVIAWQALADHYQQRVADTSGAVDNPFRFIQALCQAGTDAETAIENGSILEGDGSILTLRFFAWRIIETLYGVFPDPRIPVEPPIVDGSVE